jgi:AcrR family transcriptional regulator
VVVSYIRSLDGTELAMAPGTPRRTPSGETAERILAAAKRSLLEGGYAALSTRAIAGQAAVPLSQIHYHFGSKRQLVLALLEAENEERLQRQTAMYGADQPLWKQWEQACDYLEDDLASGYVRVLQEMTAAGWSDEAVAVAVRRYVHGWFRLLTGITRRFAATGAGLGPFEPEEVATLVGIAFLGAETLILLGVPEDEIPNRAALRKIGALIRAVERQNE